MTTELTAGQGNIDGRKDVLMKDIKGAVGDTDLAKDMLNATVEDIAATRSKLEAMLSDAKARLDEARLATVEKAKQAADVTDKYVRDNPWSVLGAAVAAAFLVGFILRRR